MMTETWKDANICPHCMTEDIVTARGPKNAPVLIIGGFPDDKEVISGRPFSGNAGMIFKAELGKVGLDLKAFRLMYMWHHIPNKKPECFELGMSLVMEELKHRQVVLLVGNEPIKYFCKKSVDNVNGLKIISPLISAPLVMACVNPNSVFSKSIGELRFAIKQFENALSEAMIK